MKEMKQKHPDVKTQIRVQIYAFMSFVWKQPTD